MLKFPDWLDHGRWVNYQKPIVQEILDRFSEGNDLVVLDAPVGAGKTWIAEATRQERDSTGAYICTTKSLQAQFVRSFPYAALISGRANYTPTDVEEGPWNTTPTCADCDGEQCTLCLVTDLCPYSLAKQDAYEADLFVTNTAYFIGEANSPRSKFTGQEFVIVDEADCLEQEIMSQVSIDISPRMQKFLGIRPPKFKTEQARKGRQSWEEWFNYAIPFIDNKRKAITGRELQDKRRRVTLSRLLERLKTVYSDLDAYIYAGYEKGRIEFKPVMVDHVAPNALWRHGKKWLCMSATIISPEQFVADLGYEGSWAPVTAPSTFPVERRPIYYCPAARMINKLEEQEWPKMAPALDAVLEQFPDDRVLVHTHSYKLTSHLRNNLTTRRPVFSYMDAADREKALTDYEATEGAVLLASSFERGIDLPDDLCRVIVIAKVPAPYLGDKQVNTRLFGTPNGDSWYSMLTARALVQMTGRGMRHELDSCTTVILDAQFATFYNKWKSKYWSEEDGRWVEGHRLFPEYFREAIHWESEQRFEIRAATRRLAAV